MGSKLVRLNKRKIRADISGLTQTTNPKIIIKENTQVCLELCFNNWKWHVGFLMRMQICDVWSGRFTQREL